jgi:hypothetical protein
VCLAANHRIRQTMPKHRIHLGGHGISWANMVVKGKRRLSSGNLAKFAEQTQILNSGEKAQK